MAYHTHATPRFFVVAVVFLSCLLKQLLTRSPFMQHTGLLSDLTAPVPLTLPELAPALPGALSSDWPPVSLSSPVSEWPLSLLLTP